MIASAGRAVKICVACGLVSLLGTLVLCLEPGGIATASESSELPSAADVAEGLAMAAKEEEKAEAALAEPEAIEERQASETAFVDLDLDEARNLLHARFSKQFDILNADPARLISDAVLQRVLEGGEAAAIVNDGRPQLLDAGVPVVTQDEGEVQKVDLTLVEGEEGLEPENPIVPVSLPENADDQVLVGDHGLGISAVGVSDESSAELFGDKNAFYLDAREDTDMVVSPIAEGVEFFEQLRSAGSPEELHYAIEMPADANLSSDGNGGAQISRGDATLGRIPFPTAVDAQGTQVPVELEVETDSITLSIPHRAGDFAYPILVDPALVEDWSSCSWYNGCNLGALDDPNVWVWGGSGHAWIYHDRKCFWACWGSGRGLYIGGEWGNHGPNEYGQFTYTPPGSTSWVASANLNPFWRSNFSCPKSSFPQPHDYDGLWSPSNGWVPLETNRANDFGNAAPAGYGRVVVFGLGTAGAWAKNNCNRTIMLSGVSVAITDSDVPSWNTAPSAPDTWTDTTVVPITGTATDNGLGMRYLNVYKAPNGGGGYDFIGNADRGCSGLKQNPCGATWTGTITNYNVSALPNGVNWLDVFAYDPLGVEHHSQGMPVHVNVDHSKPTITRSGELFGPSPNVYKGEIVATDGSAAAFNTAQSGMKSLQFYVDKQLAKRFPEEANPPACNKPQQGINMASCQFKVPIELERTLYGKHEFEIRAIDSLNHETKESFFVELPKDVTGPTLTVTGPLKNAAGGWVTNGATTVTLEAKDAAAGVVEEAVYVDGTHLAKATQECFAGGCGLTKTLNVSLAGYGDGPHTVKAVAKDSVGNITESSWTVSIDTGVPTLDSVTAPELPEGWTPQLSSFNLNYTASDTGSGVKKVEITRPASTGATLTSYPFNSSCTGTVALPCPAATSGTASISTTTMAQGINNVTVKAYDAMGRVSSAQTVTVFIDRSAPTIVSASGPLLEGGESLIGVITDLNLTVQDFGSGIASLEVLVDEEVVENRTLDELIELGAEQTCGGQSCELTYATEALVGAGLEPGPHTVEFVVKDQVGQSASRAKQVVIDTRTPEVEMSGTLYNAQGEELPGGTGTLEVAVDDGSDPYDAGIASIEVSVDGTPVQARAKLVIADKNNHRIQEFNDKGEFIRAFGSLGSGNGQLSSPSGVAVDSKGNIWVADSGNDRIQKFTEAGGFLLKCGSTGSANGQFSGWGPKDVAIDASDNVWVTDYSGRAQKFNSACEFVKSVGSYGSGKGQFVESAGIDVGPGGKVWISDWVNNRVTVFSEGGEFIRQFGTGGTGNGQFSHPDAIDVDSRGIAWVGDQSNGRVEAFSEQGEYITQFGAKGSGAGQFSFAYPMGIVLDSRGNLWVGDASNHRFQKWIIPSYSPSYASSFGAPGTANGQFQHPGDVAVIPGPCEQSSCPPQGSKTFSYDEATWGSGPHTVTVTVTDGVGNVDVEEVRVNEPLNAVAPECPTAEPEALSGGQVLGTSAAVSGIEGTIPDVLEPSKESSVSEPIVTSEPEGVSLDELGIDVEQSEAGGGLEDEAAGVFTVGQAACLQPLETTGAALDPTIVNDAAVVYPNSAPDTDTVIRPLAVGTAVVQTFRGEDAPTEFSWKVHLEPGQELVELEDGGIAVVDPEGFDFDPEVVPPAPEAGLASLTDAEIQVAQAEHDLLAANAEVEGEVALMVPAPELYMGTEMFVPGMLRITGATVITAELPPGAVAETEAMIIRLSPPAEPESICASVAARAPEYASRVCGGEDPDSEVGGEETEPYMPADLATTGNAGLNADIIAVHQEVNRLASSGAQASAYVPGETKLQQIYCEGHRSRCTKFRLDGLLAAVSEDDLYNGSNSEDTMANAFRHAVWNALMRRSFSQAQLQALVYSEAHEQFEWSNLNPHLVRRKQSRMDILNNIFGFRHSGSSDLETCDIVRKKTSTEKIFIGAKRDPWKWAKNFGYAYNRPVYRKLKSEAGEYVYPTGAHCDDVRISVAGIEVNPLDPPSWLEY